MSEIIKTDAIVLRKINFGDTSRIAQFYSHDYGKISAIIKGARTPKSKNGMMVDTLNLIQLIFYKKETREVQLVKDVDLIKYYAHIKDDYERLKYASAIIELLSNLTSENEHNKKLFDGTVRILNLLDEVENNPQILFVKYFFFLLKEIGYEFQIKHCNVCGKEFKENESASYNYEAGIMCSECKKDRLTNFNLTEELFNLIICLNTKQNNIFFTAENINYIITMLEKFLMYQVQEFKGLKSLK
jgi:DNA repair protein RecO (recombination protein O)